MNSWGFVGAMLGLLIICIVGLWGCLQIDNANKKALVLFDSLQACRNRPLTISPTIVIEVPR